jgi:hypothetical protein
MTTPPQTPKPTDPNHDFTVRIVMLREADRALFEGASKDEWRESAALFFAAARNAKMQLIDFKGLLQ